MVFWKEPLGLWLIIDIFVLNGKYTLNCDEGEGNKDVSDQIENEDMLDGAYDGTEKEEEQKDTPEEENGIEMSENFDEKLQAKMVQWIQIICHLGEFTNPE